MCIRDRHGVIDLLDRGAHGVDGVDRAEDDRIIEASGVIADTDGFEIGYDGEVLPYSLCLLYKSRCV